MPAMACAALPSTFRETELSPATSTTEYIIVISDEPTYGAVLPLATVETMSLGSPIGSARMAGVISAVPPLPPMPMTPATRPARCSARRYDAKASLMSATAKPRSTGFASRWRNSGSG